jgi:peptide/nickel transport system permease protein
MRFVRSSIRLVGQALFVALAVGTLSFIMTSALPGDAAFRIAAGRYGYDYVSAANAEAVRVELGLDRPWLSQLIDWLSNLLQGRLGTSMVSGETVVSELAHQLGATIKLALVAWLLALALGVGLGCYCALKQGFAARVLESLASGLRASPAFLIGVVLLLIFAVHLQWLPAAGDDQPAHLILPASTLALALCAGIAQVTKHQLQEVMKSEYIEFAFTKGLRTRTIVLVHAARNAALPVLAFSSVQLVLLVEGVVVVESLFAWPGIGHALVHAIFARDVPVIQGTALTLGLMFVLFNGLLDALLNQLDPRLSRPKSAQRSVLVQRLGPADR